MLPDAWNVIVVTVGSHADYEEIVGHLVHAAGVQATRALHHLPPYVQPAGVGQVEMVLVPEPYVSDRLDDAAELQRADRRAGQQGREEEVVSGTDDDHVEQLLVGFSEDAVASPAGAQDHESPSLAGALFASAGAGGEVAVVARPIRSPPNHSHSTLAHAQRNTSSLEDSLHLWSESYPVHQRA